MSTAIQWLVTIKDPAGVTLNADAVHTILTSPDNIQPPERVRVDPSPGHYWLIFLRDGRRCVIPAPDRLEAYRSFRHAHALLGRPAPAIHEITQLSEHITWL